MAAYIFRDSLSKPLFRSDLPRPIDALKLYPQDRWASLSIIGEAGIQSVKDGFSPSEFEIFHNREQMLRAQDFIVYEREGAAVAAWGFMEWALAASLAVSIGTSIYSIVQANKMKTPGNLNRTQESATNRIQERTNEPRINQRVERIYGQLRAFPSEIMRSYITYKNNEQVEYGAYCIGQGDYSIDDVVDGKTSGDIIGGGWSASFYNAGANVINDQPYYNIGSVVSGEALRTNFESNDTANDEIDPPNDVSVYVPSFCITGDEQSKSASLTVKDKPVDYDLRDTFLVGEDITFTDLVGRGAKKNPLPIYDSNGDLYPANQVMLVDLTQTATEKIKYRLTNVTKDTLTISIPDWLADQTKNGWYSLNDQEIKEYVSGTAVGYKYDFYSIDDMTIPGKSLHITVNSIEYIIVAVKRDLNPRIDKIGSYALGPYGAVSGTKVQVNISTDGLYYIDVDGNDHPYIVDGRIICRELNDNNQPTSVTSETTWRLNSNSVNVKKQNGISVFVNPNFKNYTVEVIRDTRRDKDYSGQVVDVVRLEALYFYKDNSPEVYPNKTIIITKRSQSSFGAGRARRLSALVTSKMMINGQLTPSRYFDDIICDAAADPVFGRRSAATVADMRVNLRAARDQLIDYFGREDVAYFDYCIDSENTTFESFVRQVASAVFCTAYLKQNLRFAPDVYQPIDTAIFGHGNKLIADESLKYSFDDLQGKKYDCVEVRWRNPENMDAQEVIYIPNQGSNPKTIDLSGVRNERNATTHGWREWYRITSQRYSYECTVGLEGTQLIPNQRIGIVNNCCGESFDGSFVGWDNGVNVRFSQEADLSAGGYKIVIQSPNGGVGVFGVTQGVNLYHGVLSEAPTFTINTNLKENLTVYRIAKEDELITESYALSEPELTDKGIKLKAVNYAPIIYSKDLTL